MILKVCLFILVKTCDPLSDKNVVNTLFPTNKSEEIPDRSIIVVSARVSIIIISMYLQLIIS